MKHIGLQSHFKDKKELKVLLNQNLKIFLELERKPLKKYISDFKILMI
tara:strand:+ start:696 stop:839 length:144 start_codon:yes stop_codon:yes gene_type:complete